MERKASRLVGAARIDSIFKPRTTSRSTVDLHVQTKGGYHTVFMIGLRSPVVISSTPAFPIGHDLDGVNRKRGFAARLKVPAGVVCKT